MWRILAMAPPMSCGWSGCRRLACPACWRYRFVPARNRQEARNAMPKTATAAALVLRCALAAPASAQSPADFYKGRQIKLVVGTAAGQDYDLWARLIGRHITRHIPGNPTLIVEN